MAKKSHWNGLQCVGGACPGLIPVVMDFLDVVGSTNNHYRSLGGWTYEFADYVAANMVSGVCTAGSARKWAARVDGAVPTESGNPEVAVCCHQVSHGVLHREVYTRDKMHSYFLSTQFEISSFAVCCKTTVSIKYSLKEFTNYVYSKN